VNTGYRASIATSGAISAAPSPPGLSGEFNTDKNASLGLSVINQKAGNGGYNYTTAYGNFAYTGVRLAPTATSAW